MSFPRCALCLFLLTLMVAAQEKSQTDAQQDDLAGPIKSVSSAVVRTSVQWQQPGGLACSFASRARTATMTAMDFEPSASMMGSVDKSFESFETGTDKLLAVSLLMRRPANWIMTRSWDHSE